MRMTEHGCIAAVGASTPIGRDAYSSAAAVRAGISGIVQHPHMIDSAGEPMRAALAPWLDIGLGGAARFEALLLPAIDEVLTPFGTEHSLRLALALGLPAPRPGLPEHLRDIVAAAALRCYGRWVTTVACFECGHAAGLVALDSACGRLAAGDLDGCIVAGVDSYLDPQTLEWIEACDQYHGAGRLNNAWGFLPGEAAGALLILRPSVAHRLGAAVLARILSVGCAQEDKRIKTETVCLGEGLTAAFRAGVEGLPKGGLISDIYCDMNGEPYRADEYGFTCLRMGELLPDASGFNAPADCWGDVCAASGPLSVALAVIAGQKRYARGRHALAWSSSEGGERAAALIEVPFEA